MVINSQFKDYYDFVANQFGGGDPRIVYSRKRLVPLDPKQPLNTMLRIETIGGCHLSDPARFNGYYYYLRSSEPRMDYMYLIVTGKAYLLGRPESLIDRCDISTYKITEPNYEKAPRWVRDREKLEFGKEYDYFVELCRKVGSPVFVIAGIEHKRNSRTDVVICGQCPILSRLGMASRISPQQMYQDIAMFVGNRMKDTPDTKPPVELDNKQRILKAGFDLRQSFRHRI